MFLSNLSNFLTPTRKQEWRKKTRKTAQDLYWAQNLFRSIQKKDTHVSKSTLQSLIQILEQSGGDRRVALLVPHMISNLALVDTHATRLCSLGAIRCLFTLLEQHSEDNRVIWKTSSALWNLFSIGGSEIKKFIPADAVKRLLRCIKPKCGVRAAHTLFGALGNLVLIFPESFLTFMTVQKLEYIGKSVRGCQENSIIAHYGALIANMGTNVELAKRCVEAGQVSVMISIFRENKANSRECRKHLCAALHNLSDVDGFVKMICKSEGIEVLHTLVEKLDADIARLIDATFDLAHIPRTATTSLQVATLRCDANVINKLMWKPNTEVNVPNSDGKTPCDLAIQREMGEIVEIMVAAGGEWTEEISALSSVIQKHLQNGLHHRAESKRKMGSLITGSTMLVHDMSGVVSSFISGVEMLTVLR